MEQDYFFKDVIGIVWRRAWVIVLMAAIAVGVAVGIELTRAPVYEASTKLLVGETARGAEGATSLGSDIMGLQQATQTVAVAAASKPVAEGVVEELDLAVGPEALLKNVDAKQVDATQFVELTYQNADPETVQEVANAFGDVAAKRVSESSAGASGMGAEVWEYAGTPEAPVGPGPLRNAVLALGLGIMLGVGLAFLLEYLNDGWRSPEEVEQISGVPNLGTVPDFEAVGARNGRY